MPRYCKTCGEPRDRHPVVPLHPMQRLLISRNTRSLPDAIRLTKEYSRKCSLKKAPANRRGGNKHGNGGVVYLPDRARAKASRRRRKRGGQRRGVA